VLGEVDGMARRLRPKELKRRLDPKVFPFVTTEECEPLEEIIGQERAVKALELGLGIKDFRYNIYVAGSPGTGKNSTVKAFLKRLSAHEETPSDWCYVHNFQDPYCPIYLELPAGWGQRFRSEMKRLIERLKREIPAALQSEFYQKRRQEIQNEFAERQRQLFEEISQRAKKKGFVLQQTEQGVRGVPLLGGEPLSEEKLHELSMEELKKIDRQVEAAQEDLQEMVREIYLAAQGFQEELEEQIKSLNRETAELVVAPRISELSKRYEKFPRIVRYLEAVEEDVLDHLDDFLPQSQKQGGDEGGQGVASPLDGLLSSVELVDPLRRYEVNVLIDRGRLKGTPVVVQENATYTNLFGRIERRMQLGLGAITSDFTLIRPGSLHEANGGYLVLNADNLFKYWASWEALKIAIRSRQISIEDPGHLQGYPATTEGIRPEPIPLDVKVILIGSQDLYLTLQSYDEDFGKLFNVKCDFADSMEWKEEYTQKFGPFIRARVEERPGLRHFHRSGVARVVEYASELTEDQEKLSARFSDLMTIIREASYWARMSGAKYVKAEHVERAIEEKVYRHNLLEERIHELIARGDLLVEVEGEAIGQVNGLYVMTWGDFSFGRPARVTANVYAGKDGVVSIEREAELSGTAHTKGLLILKGWLGEKFAYDKPLSLTASITFEQSYSKIDGDSASSTELYALISAIAEVPIRQGIAVTGSVNQKGEIQPIGGVNEKIEGFYAVCKAKGLTGEQGVMIPHQNVHNLTLKGEVIEAVRKGKFHIWAVKTVDEGIELLTGMRAGRRTKRGFSKGSVYARVDERLRQLAASLERASESEGKRGKG
jgi:lon-related putative ATP-dependent protease